MIQVQRFNKVLKLAVILGDLVILNVLFISFILHALFQEVSYCIVGEPVPTKLYSGYSATCSISLFYRPG